MSSRTTRIGRLLPGRTLARRPPLPSSSCFAPRRHFHLTPARYDAGKKPSMKGISAIRQAVPGTSMLKAKEALAATFNAAGQEDVTAALTWLEEDRQKSGAKKAEKIAARVTRQGMVGVCVLQADSIATGESVFPPPTGVGIVELNCETDFVARNELFVKLVQDVAHSAAVFLGLKEGAPRNTASESPRVHDTSVEEFLSFPLMSSSPESSSTAAQPRTINDAIIDAISRLGEKISLARLSSISPFEQAASGSSGINDTLVAASFSHGSPPGSAISNKGCTITLGQVAAFALTRFQNLPEAVISSPESRATRYTLTRSLARQAAGMETTSIRPETDKIADAASGPPTALYSQPFIMLLPNSGIAQGENDDPEASVETVLKRWEDQNGEATVDVVSLRRWTLGETA